MKNSKALLLCIIGVLAACTAVVKGCEYLPESTFELAQGSRLPKWIVPPVGLARADVHVSMNYYTFPWPSASYTGTANDRTFLKLRGRNVCNPFSLNNSDRDSAPSYPSYQAVSVNGATEIMEHKKMEPVFYVTDDPAVWSKYKELGCGK